MKIILFFVFLCSLSIVLSQTIPTQIHIALAGNDDNGNSNSIAVSWQTTNNTITSVVKYGLNSNDYVNEVSGVSSSYYETYHHHAVLPDLIPSTTYYYIVGDESGGWSAEYSFVSAPLSSQLRNDFSFAVFADLGSVNGQYTISLVESMKEDIDLVWHGGDVSYADDSFLHKGCLFKFCYEEAWDTYMNEIQSWAAQLPYMVAVGNHEADCHDPACLFNKERREKLSNFTAYNTRFRMPSEESNGVLNMHYSFNYGNVHFISLDTETGYPGSAEENRYIFPCGGFNDQLTWLENDLIQANIDRTTRPWIFAIGHHPMYQGDSINTDFQAAMEDLFYKYGVDIYFSGHVHSYERDYPVYQGVPEYTYTNPSSTVHIMVGGAGNDEMHDAQLASHDIDPTNHESEGKWVESRVDGAWTVITDKDDHVGIGKVTIIDDSNLKFEYYRSSTGVVYDSVNLVRDHSVYANKFNKK
eukprot:gene20343-26406_t